MSQMVKKIIGLSLAVALFPPLLGSVSAATGAVNSKSKWIITLRADSPSDPIDLAVEYGLQVEQPYHIYRFKSPDPRIPGFRGLAAGMDEEALKKLRQDPRVLAVEPDCLVTVTGQTNPAGILRMGITNFPVAHINSTSYWNSVTGKSQPIDVDVAVLDSGIDLHHPDLNVVEAQDFTGTGHNGDDCENHGTGVAGVIGALNNTFGVVGVAPGARLWSVQVLCGGPGGSLWANVLAGMNYISQHADQISVVNASIVSIGTPAPCVATQAAVANIVNQGVVFVAGAANDGIDVAGIDGVFGVNPATGVCDDRMPAALPEAMTVSAMDVHTNQIPSWSNYSYVPRPTNYVHSPGGAIDVAAPGDDSGASPRGILTTAMWQSYTATYGTSLAAPHVTGLVALYIAANGRAHDAAGVYAIRQAIVDNSVPQSKWNNANPNPQNNGVTPKPAPLAMPSLNWIPSFSITGQGMSSQGYWLGFPSIPGYAYSVESKDSLDQPWSSLTNTLGCGSTIQVTDTNLNSAMRAYRVQRAVAP